MANFYCVRNVKEDNIEKVQDYVESSLEAKFVSRVNDTLFFINVNEDALEEAEILLFNVAESSDMSTDGLEGTTTRIARQVISHLDKIKNTEDAIIEKLHVEEVKVAEDSFEMSLNDEADEPAQNTESDQSEEELVTNKKDMEDTESDNSSQQQVLVGAFSEDVFNKIEDLLNSQMDGIKEQLSKLMGKVDEADVSGQIKDLSKDVSELNECLVDINNSTRELLATTPVQTTTPEQSNQNGVLSADKLVDDFRLYDANQLKVALYTVIYNVFANNKYSMSVSEIEAVGKFLDAVYTEMKGGN